MGSSQSQIVVPFDELFEVYSDIHSETSTKDCEKKFTTLAKSIRIDTNGFSSSTTPIEKNEYEEEINRLVKWINLSGDNEYLFKDNSQNIVNKQVVVEEILQTKENIDNIAKDGFNRNYLGYFSEENTFKCVFISFSVTEKGSFKHLIYNFTIREHQLKHFLQDLYSAYLEYKLSLQGRSGMEKFCDKYLMTLAEQEIKEIEGYYKIV